MHWPPIYPRYFVLNCWIFYLAQSFMNQDGQINNFLRPVEFNDNLTLIYKTKVSRFDI